MIAAENPLGVKYFTPSIRGGLHSLNEIKYEVFFEDLDQKVDPPKQIRRGKSRVFYSFE